MLKKIVVIFLLMFTFILPQSFAETHESDAFIIVNKTTHRLALIKNNRIVMQVPVGTGRTPQLTPEGLFHVVVMVKNPYYIKKNIPGGSPKNPLGTRWIGFDAWGTNGRIYGVHGNNNPASIGYNVSSGCIRLYNKDVERLYDQMSLHTPIFVTSSSKTMTQLAQEQQVIR
ncbi:L,D-transpeptidase family protein [Terrilactibacillus sp. BCM23-1]|uniref:L,D-transpeptidase family protein n=1 Tax=Terrilactibacillus tamarindi TaxID=2599694 RepID=A0A6N8CLL7_9BACI|nr:L,D-transpeptidase [Terrilactibacillus tamarindi]MTT30854.1 L,D-transpeptidase family protein [Terrilactibacillus tamarindi]